MLKNNQFAASELVLNPDGSIYHLNLLPEDIADTILIVGDPDRVAAVSQHFDRIEVIKSKREFITHTGFIGDKKLSVISTGMGPGNIDIFMNEIDALVNIDLKNKCILEQKKSLNIIRLGTSGSLHPDIKPDEIVISQFSIGLDAAIVFYGDYFGIGGKALQQSIQKSSIQSELEGISHYYTAASETLNGQILPQAKRGITITAPGFYAAQGRTLRGQISKPLNYDNWHQITHADVPITNMEMETSCIYALAERLGHQALSVNCILANRQTGEFSQRPKVAVKDMIALVLESIV